MMGYRAVVTLSLDEWWEFIRATLSIAVCACNGHHNHQLWWSSSITTGGRPLIRQLLVPPSPLFTPCRKWGVYRESAEPDPWAFVCFVPLATSSCRCLLISCGTGSLSSWPSRCPAWSTSLCSGEVISCCFCFVFWGLCLCWQVVTHWVILKKKDISLFVGRKTFLPSKD